MKLTENFYLSEFTKSPTASRNGIHNMPKGLQVDNLVLLCKHILQPLRDWYKKPIKINSGYRSPALNTLIGGATSSQHLFGQAADIDTLDSNADLFFHIRHNLDFDQLIWEFGDHTNPDWIHVSYNENRNRGEILRAERINGKTVYSKMV
jgi:hypothetical protein